MNPMITRLTLASNIDFFASVFDHTHTATFGLTDMDVNQTQMNDNTFDLEERIEEVLHVWAHDQTQTVVKLSSPLHLANRETTVDYILMFNDQVARQKTFKLGELLKTDDYPIVSAKRQLGINLKLSADCASFYQNCVKYRWQLAS